jgi:SAM-dependent methyltransferase
VTNDILATDARRYRAASEELHRDSAPQDRHAANLRMLWECGLADLIRADFYGLFDFDSDARGLFLDAGCGTAFEAGQLARLVPALRYVGVDISSLRLAEAVAAGTAEPNRLLQSALERMPFSEASFDYVGSHEVIEHVEEPAVALAEIHRVLKPGGICVIATPNGASLWVEHVRQRLARLCGFRGAPVGEDHTRTPAYWRRRFRAAGLVVERQIFDGAAFEFLTYVAPARWMRGGVRLLEPLRALPIVNLLVCDRVKFRLHKPRDNGPSPHPDADAVFRPICPLCREALVDIKEGAVCASGHRFGRNRCGLLDFTMPMSDDDEADYVHAPPLVAEPPLRRSWGRRLRRGAMAMGCLVYIALLALLAPLGFVVGRFCNPLRRVDRASAVSP